MEAVLEHLTRVPRREGGVLDMPLTRFVDEHASPAVSELLLEYAQRYDKPTLRVVLADARLRQWLRVAGDSRVAKSLRTTLMRVAVIAERTHVEEEDEDEDELDDGGRDLRVDPADGAVKATGFDELIAWATDAGVFARLADPAGILLQRTRVPEIQQSLHPFRHSTVGALAALQARAEDDRHARPAGPKRLRTLARLAQGWVRECGMRAIAAREKEARLVALGHAPTGDGPKAFAAGLASAIALLPPRSEPPAGTVIVSALTFENAPRAIVVKATLCPDRHGRARERSACLLLDDWRERAFETHVRTLGKTDAPSAREIAHVLLYAVRDVLRDPSHPLHDKLMSFLAEPPWKRVLRGLDDAVPIADTQPFERVEWHLVLRGNAVGLSPRMSRPPVARDAGRMGSVMCGVDSIAHPQMGARISPLDRAVAKALTTPTMSMHYFGRTGSADSEERENVFKALSLLEGNDNVRTKVNVPVRVVSGKLAVRLERHDDAAVGGAPGWRFGFSAAHRE
ncbi:MAG: hypothetical protein JWM74_811, partial [Myxococcaceae bacterium]|nr:hypothetical protein [Myxococcaceae bacterium]